MKNLKLEAMHRLATHEISFLGSRDAHRSFAPRFIDADFNSYDICNVEALEPLRDRIKGAVESLIDDGFFAHNGARRAYITFATPDYEWGLRVWLRSLRKVSSVPAIIMASHPLDIPSDIADAVVLVVPGLFNSNVNAHRPEFTQTFTKLWCFAMTPLQRLIFVDVDCLFLQSLDHLFDSSDFLVAPDYVEHTRTSHFNSGMMAFTPTHLLEDEIFSRAPAAPSYDGGDQGSLNAVLMRRVTFVPETNNLLRHYYYFSGRQTLDDVRMIHFIVKKPWELNYRETPDALLVDLDDEWTRHLTHDDLLDLVRHWRRAVFLNGGRSKIENMHASSGHHKHGDLWDGLRLVARAVGLRRSLIPLALIGVLSLGGVLGLIALLISRLLG